MQCLWVVHTIISSIWGGVAACTKSSIRQLCFLAATAQRLATTFTWSWTWNIFLAGLRDRVYVMKSACVLLFACVYYPHLLRARKLRITANRLFPDEFRASGFPILEERIEHTWSNDLNPSTLSSCKWIVRPTYLLLHLAHPLFWKQKISIPLTKTLKADIFERLWWKEWRCATACKGMEREKSCRLPWY